MIYLPKLSVRRTGKTKERAKRLLRSLGWVTHNKTTIDTNPDTQTHECTPNDIRKDDSQTKTKTTNSCARLASFNCYSPPGSVRTQLRKKFMRHDMDEIIKSDTFYEFPVRFYETLRYCTMEVRDVVESDRESHLERDLHVDIRDLAATFTVPTSRELASEDGYNKENKAQCDEDGNASLHSCKSKRRQELIEAARSCTLRRTKGLSVAELQSPSH